MIGFITTARHVRELAAKDVLIDSLDKTAAFYKLRAEAAEREARCLNDRLQNLTPARDQGGRFAAKARRLQSASPPVGTSGYGLEDFT